MNMGTCANLLLVKMKEASPFSIFKTLATGCLFGVLYYRQHELDEKLSYFIRHQVVVNQLMHKLYHEMEDMKEEGKKYFIVRAPPPGMHPMFPSPPEMRPSSDL